MLWSDAGPVLQPRVEGGQPWTTDRVGPTRDMVSFWLGWPWRRRGGDWLDADGVLHGPKAWATGRLDTDVVTLDVTALVRRCQDQARPLAVLLQRTGGQRRMRGRYSDQPPTLTVGYPDGSQETIAVHVTGAMDGSSNTPLTIVPDLAFPVGIEFRRPERVIVSAVLTLHLSLRTTYTAQVSAMIVDAPRNEAPVQLGIAAEQPADAGLTQHPATLGLARVADGGAAPLYSGRPINLNSRDAWSMDMWGGTADVTKLPYVLGGQLLGDKDWQVLPSTTPGLQPLRPGLGVLRMVKLDQIDEDGEVDGYGRSGSVNLNAMLPPKETGLLQEVYVRHYVRIGPLARGRDVRQMMRTAADKPQIWSDLAGKMGMTPAHNTTYGGVSGTAGGGNGWSMRLSWSYRPEITDGPDAGAIPLHLHLYDFQQRNVPGHNYANRNDGSLSQRGAIGVLYPGYWYCVEMRLKLNSVDRPGVLADGTPHVINGVPQFWTPDGEIDYWIDGRLACSLRGLVLRSLPIVPMQPGHNPAYTLPPMRELGIRNWWFDWYHGGTTTMSMDMTVDLAALAWARKYIGPMV